MRVKLTKKDLVDFEYNEFIVKFMTMLEDVKNDFSSLCPENKKRFNRDVKKLIAVNFPEILQFLEGK